MKYIKIFNTDTDYNTYINSQDKRIINVSRCKNENDVHYNHRTWAEEYLTFVALENGTFTFSTNAINYSLDNGETWIELAANTASPTVTSGSKIMWKATLTPDSSNGIGTFSATGNFNVQGNAMSLLYGYNFKGQTDLTGKDYAFYQLFYNNIKVINAEKLSLPATTLANGCYRYMFYGCASLTTVPNLPATTLANNCYNAMFCGCSSLTTAPELPATTLESQCYESMFQNCTSLITVPALPATTLASRCYDSMFANCSSLTTVQSILPATTLADLCYADMFDGCTSLTTAPELPATTLTNCCYFGMFLICTSLTTAPELPATTLERQCYESMFNGCTSLTTAPSILPATTLADNCYCNMFLGCTSLITAPELPATTLKSQCYRYMFYGCTLLNYIKAMFTTTPGTTYTRNWVNGVASSGTFIKNSAATWNVTGTNGIPSGWTIQTANS